MSRGKLNIAVSLAQNGDPRLIWSGTPAHLIEALENMPNVQVSLIRSPMERSYGLVNRASGATGRLEHRVNWEVEPRLLKWMTRRVSHRATKCNADVVLYMGWMPLEHRPTIPSIFWGDAVLSQRVNRVKHWSSLSKRTRALASKVEQDCFDGVDAIIMPSEWASSAARSVTNTPVHIVPFGSNVSDTGAAQVRSYPGDRVRLLTIGLDWQRKGIDTSVRTVAELRKRGVEATLDVVGASPPRGAVIPNFVTLHGHISKADIMGEHRIQSMFQSADIFILPSRSDPSPMVLGEAGCYGLPVVASNVDGIPERVEHGGILLDVSADSEAYASACQQILQEASYLTYCQGARADFETRSDWKISAKLVTDLCYSLRNQRR